MSYLRDSDVSQEAVLSMTAVCSLSFPTLIFLGPYASLTQKGFGAELKETHAPQCSSQHCLLETLSFLRYVFLPPF